MPSRGINDSDDPVAVAGMFRRFPWLAGLPEVSAIHCPRSEHEPNNAWLAADKPDDWVPLAWADGRQLDIPCEGVVIRFADATGRTFWQHITRMPMTEALRRQATTTPPRRPGPD